MPSPFEISQQRADLSVVVVTAGSFRNIRRTVACLKKQTIAGQLDLVLVAATENSMQDLLPGELDGFAAVQFIYTPLASENVDKAAAIGAQRVSAEFVALIEDHAFPDPDWAETMVDIHRKAEWAAVAPLMVNANPGKMLSWTNLLIAYGPWTEPAPRGERDAIPGHNLCYRQSVLRQYGDQLINKLGRNAGLLEELAEQGHRFYQSDARLAHANPSRLAPTVKLRFNAGRLYGWARAEINDWTPLHRFLYVVGGPIIPFLRYRRLKAELFARGKRSHLVPRVLPALFFGLVLDALGQMAGYALGPGKSIEVLATFEMDRMRHLTAGDRKLLQA